MLNYMYGDHLKHVPYKATYSLHYKIMFKEVGKFYTNCARMSINKLYIGLMKKNLWKCGYFLKHCEHNVLRNNRPNRLSHFFKYLSNCLPDLNCYNDNTVIMAIKTKKAIKDVNF